MVLMGVGKEGGRGYELYPAHFLFIHSALLNSAKVFVLSTHIFLFAAQKQSAELCRGQIKAWKLKTLVVKSLSGSTTTPSFPRLSPLQYLLCALSDLSLAAIWPQVDCSPFFFKSTFDFISLNSSQWSPDSILVVHRSQCSETARIALPKTCNVPRWLSATVNGSETLSFGNTWQDKLCYAKNGPLKTKVL